MKAFSWMTIAAAGLATGCALFGYSYTVGGTVTGVAGQGLVLQDNASDNLSVTSNGAFVFAHKVKTNAAYSVTVKTQPTNPVQTCTVRNGSGTMAKTNVTNVIVSCTQPGRFAYVANQQSNNLSAYSIDAANGTLFPVTGSPFADLGCLKS